MDYEGLLNRIYTRSFTRNPYHVFQILRRVAPVWNVSSGRWLFRHYDWILTRYDDCAAVFRDRRFGAAEPDEIVRRFGPIAGEGPSVRELASVMALLNPPDHTRLRGLVIRAFTSRKIQSQRSSIQECTDRLLDQVASSQEMDVVEDLARPLATFAICQLLGIPEEDREQLARAMSRTVLLEPARPSRETIDIANSATEEGRAYLESLFEKRRRCPTDDLITQLLQASDDGDQLTTTELLANIRFLFVAGFETTINLIGSGLLALLLFRKQWELLQANPALIANAAEEMLRYDAPVQAVSRAVLEPVVLKGFALRPREVVVLMIGAANRDGAVFKNPNRFDVTRKNVRSLSFGGGIHSCIGAQLGRLELMVVLETLLRRFPNMRLKRPIRPNWRPNVVLRGLRDLPVTLS